MENCTCLSAPKTHGYERINTSELSLTPQRTHEIAVRPGYFTLAFSVKAPQRCFHNVFCSCRWFPFLSNTGMYPTDSRHLILSLSRALPSSRRPTRCFNLSIYYSCHLFPNTVFLEVTFWKIMFFPCSEQHLPTLQQANHLISRRLPKNSSHVSDCTWFCISA